jgi:hypothetical protein
MECASCRARIDDDSFFCDQCAVELLRCTGCGRLGVGKRCMFDGKPLVSLGEAAPTPAPAAPTATARTAPAPAATAGPRKLRLTNAGRGIDLQPASGDLLGRAAGPHAGVLGAFEHVSTRHACVRIGADGQWCIEDLGSTNGTFFNGVRLPTGSERQLAAGAKLMLGSLELQVGLE